MYETLCCLMYEMCCVMYEILENVRYERGTSCDTDVGRLAIQLWNDWR